MTDYSYHVCPICGIHYAVDKIVMDNKRGRRRGDNDNWYCPNGHSLIFTESEAEKQRRRAERAEQNTAFWRDKAEKEKRTAAAHKGQVTRLKRRSAAGVCPCCNRTFKQLAAHMANKHPNFVDLEVIDGGKKDEVA